MFDKMNNINSRISEIRNYGKSIKNGIKPEFVSNFEEKLNNSLNTTKSESSLKLKEKSYHPFLENDVEEVKVEENIKIDKQISLLEKNELIDKSVKDASKKYNISENIIKSVITQESGFDQFAVSKAGAMGLMQLMPKTALEMGVSKPFDIAENIDGGVKYLKKMLDKYNGDLTLSLAAYNAGPNRVDQANGIPDITETQDYVKKINAMLNKEID